MIEKRLIICAVANFDNRFLNRGVGETIFLTACDMEKERERVENEKNDMTMVSFAIKDTEQLILPVSKKEYNNLGRPSVGDMITVKVEILAEAV
ncbi:MAG TPA: hypothetical protein VIH27_04655 [Nitrososphaerales archaeon]